jgi:hypothetical protein
MIGRGAVMAYTYDLTTSVGKVRAIIRDTRGPATVFFQDDEIEFFLDLNAVNIRRAAADVLDTWASDEALVTKAVRLLDIATDGPAVAQALRAHAALLRRLADDAEMAADGGVDIAEMALGPFSIREQLVSRGLADD